MYKEDSKLSKSIIRNYILSSVSIPDLDDACDIFEAGIVNSLFAIELMTFLEKEFSIKVTTDDLDMNNFKSIDATAVFVAEKLKKN